ncbi:f-box/lrr-repeat protein 13 [Fagus crenata]
MELQNFGDDDDIFSNLPNHIVHRILFFLQLVDLSRLSYVSRRCKELCISNPCLALTNVIYDTLQSPPRFRFNNFMNRYRFKNFVDRFMAQRSLNSGLEKLQIELPTERFGFAFPPCVLNCNTLKSLFVKTDNGILKFPSASLTAGAFTMLQILQFESFRIEEDFFGEALSNFNSLKALILNKISGLKRINSSTIERLRIRDCNDIPIIDISAEKLRILLILWCPNYSSGTSLKINAPNLENFEWGGHVVDFYCIGDFSLTQASIALGLSEHHQYESSTKCNLDKLLHSMRRAKDLTLWDKFIGVLFKHGCLPNSFNNAETLTIAHTSFIGDEVPAISSLLRETTNLKNLRILNPWNINVANSMTSRKLSFKMEYWESQNLMFTNQLKYVVMDFSNGGNDVELMKYLLKNTKELKIMGISGSLNANKSLY